ncbi:MULTISPECIES: hypothetical protein [Fusobacterium]|uniref:Uncharacterized protein n=1 Tax=Fusobacterium vincentii TaxID=155615 RepID=A0AAJ1CS16_FUSVC|nr:MULTISPECIES: hypothetical protein [Fusobacterium]ERT44427.1 hypothetical protein HMPREF1768_01959 [Fusobacterium nucleatum CTI-7]MCW0263083.1 hypothetical protein [Fusobacterium vincentii]STO29914.1 Uncharacterised protein [Fusobacterium vincentii]
MSNKITNRLSKRMEHELDKLDINEKKNPIRVTKGIIVFISFIGTWKAYNSYSLFETLFPYSLIAMYDLCVYSISTKKDNATLKIFLNIARTIYTFVFFVSGIGFFNLLVVSDEDMIVIKLGEKLIKFVPYYFLFLLIVIYHIILEIELFLPLERREK